jgi:Spy/CpxP family protein refolding chaperone
MKNFILFLVITVIAAGSSFAQPRWQGRMLMHERLNLTEEQQKQIEEIRFTHRDEMIDLNADIQKQTLNLRKLRTSGDLNRAEYLKEVEKLNELKSQKAVKRAEHQMEVRELLTPEQREQLRSFDKQMRKGKRGAGYGWR